MSKLILLNGAVNSGKSTVGKMLLELCENIAFVELDDLYSFVPWMDLERAVPLNIKNGISVAKNFIDQNIDVIIAYPLSDGDYLYLKSFIDFPCEIIGITLGCDFGKNIINRGARELSNYEIERIKWMHNNGVANPDFSQVIDTTNRSMEETVDLIIERLRLKRKNVNVIEKELEWKNQ
jgi:hypothetical protein